MLSMMLDAVYVDMAQGLLLGLKPKPEFLPLFNLGEPVTTGDSELVTGRMEQSRTTTETRVGSVGVNGLADCHVIEESRIDWRLPFQ